MQNMRAFLILGMLLGAINGWAQDVIEPENIATLNRIAGEYDDWKWIFGISTTGLVVVLAAWNILGLKTLLKTKAEEWVMDKIAKEADLKVEHIKAAVREYAHIAELKKKNIWVISAAEGQQANVKKVFDGCGFAYDEKNWKHIDQINTLTLGNVDVLLFNDQPDLPLQVKQIEAVMEKFKTNVGYLYLGDKRLKSEEYRQEYKIDLDFCNSTTRLEAGLLSLLKIR